MRAMKVRDVMSSPAITVTTATPFTGIAAALVEHDISGVPVVDAAGRLVGVVSETDLVGRHVHGYRPPLRRALADYLHHRDPDRVRHVGGLSARDLMTATPDTVRPDDDLRLAAEHMTRHGHRRLAVVEDGAVVGVVTRSDVLRPFVRDDADLLAEIRRLLADPFCIAEDHAVRPSVAAGVVTLDGTVRQPHEIEIVESEVRRVPGVVAVDNRLHASERVPLTPPLPRW